MVQTFILLFCLLSTLKLSPSVCKLCCKPPSPSVLRDLLFRAIMNRITTIKSNIIVVRTAIITPTKFCSGSWSIGFGEMTVKRLI